MRILVGGLALLLPVAASAHSNLGSATPGEGERVGLPVAEIVLEFPDGIEPAFSEIRVTQGGAVETAAGADVCTATRCALPAGFLAPGEVIVNWRVLSADGHTAEGSYGFTVEAP
jgi:methionine-rich copper-binding protein CopC